jgi:hypothetical protein
LAGRFESACAYWHVRPGVSVYTSPECATAAVCLRPENGPAVELAFTPVVTASREPSSWHPEFGQTVAGSALLAHFEGPSLRSHFTW